MGHCWCHDSIVIVFEHGNTIVLNAETCHNRHLECSKSIKDMDAAYLPDVGYMIAIIDEKCIRFIKVSLLFSSGEVVIAFFSFVC